MSAWLPVAAWVLVILALSGDEASAGVTRRILAWFFAIVLPGLDPATFELIHGAVRKLAHLTEYGILGALALRAFRRTSTSWPAGRCVAAGFAVAVACAVTDETHQSFQAQRTGSVLDVLLDSAGALLGAFAMRHLWSGVQSPGEGPPA